MTDRTNDYDVLIIGGGPSGSVAALSLARQGKRVAVLEKSTFPRFQIGESFLPANFNLIRDLGLLPRLRDVPHITKRGTEFGMGYALDDKPTRYLFSDSLVGGDNEALNIARADFDGLLLDAARDAGADIHQPVAVHRIERLADGDVAVNTDAGPFTGRYLLDASGQATLVARHLGTRSALTESFLQKAAYFDHFQKVKRLGGDLEGFPTVAMCDEGWFWIIPLNDKSTSVGLVLPPSVARQSGVPADRMLRWGIQRCPMVRQRMANAVGPETNRVRGDYSYRCRPYAGPGFFLLGDAAMFLDPVFSTGVCLSMVSAMQAARHVGEVLEGRATPAAAGKHYIRFLHHPSRTFLRIIRLFYSHQFRELFLHGQGPFKIERGVLAVLAGHVFPKPAFKIAWRFRLFEMCVWLQRYLPLVPRRQRFFLLAREDEPCG